MAMTNRDQRSAAPSKARGRWSAWGRPKGNRVRAEIAAILAIGRALRFFKPQREGRVDAVACHDLECPI